MPNEKDDDKEYDPNWGGARRGTGEKTKVIRIPESLESDIKKMINEHNKSGKPHK